MYRILFTLFFLLSITNICKAQNWSLVMPNDTLVYEQQSNHQFFTIWVDSIQVNGLDTTYFMNRIPVGVFLGNNNQIYATCLGPVAAIASEYEANKTQFTGSRQSKEGDKWTVYTDTSSVVIYPKNVVGSSWLADSVNLDSMFITAIAWKYINGVESYDSIKTITIKNQVLHLSKNYGLITGFANEDQMEEFELIGVQNLNLGETVPMTLDIFDYEIGDVFRYDVYFGDSDSQTSYKEQKKVVGKQIIGDTVIYEFADGDIEKYWKGMDSFLDGYPNTLGTHESSYCGGFGFSQPVVTYVGKNSLGEIIKTNALNFNYDVYGGVWNSNIDVEQFCFEDSLNTFVKTSNFGVHDVYVAGRGILATSVEGLTICNAKQIGYVKDGDTSGIVLGMETEFMKPNLLLYPNPVQDKLNIVLEKQGRASVEVFDVMGRRIAYGYFEKEIILNTTAWKSGLVMVIIRDENGVFLERKMITIL